jgi:hypothetical protein
VQPILIVLLYRLNPVVLSVVLHAFIPESALGSHHFVLPGDGHSPTHLVPSPAQVVSPAT